MPDDGVDDGRDADQDEDLGKAPGMGQRHSFATNLCRECFVNCDTRELKAEDEVMVIKVVMPDQGVLEAKESDMPDLERGQVETIMCQPSEAHVLILWTRGPN